MDEQLQTPPPANPAQRGCLILLLPISAAFAVRLVVVYFSVPGFLVPEREHWLFGFESGKIAVSILSGHGFANPYYGGKTGPTAEIGPILPYVMAAVFALFGVYTKASAFVILSLNSFFSALTCIPIYFVAKKSFGARVSRWAVWGWVFFPYAIYFSADSMWDHALIAFLMSCIFWAALELQDVSDLWSWAGAGLLCGIAALMNAVVLSVLPFLAGWACLQLRKQGKNWLAPVLAAVSVAVLVVTPWMIRNYRVFHAPLCLRDSFALAFDTGNVGNATHWWNPALDPSGNPNAMAEFHRLGERAFMAEKARQEHQFLRAHPGIFVLRSLRRFLYMWSGYWSFESKYLQQESFDPYNIPFCSTLTILAIIGFWRAFKQDSRAVVPYAILLIVFPLVYYATIPEMGYREAYDPELLILVCCGIAYWRSPKPHTKDGASEPALTSESVA
jgi:4-amino-4-deoxy-L-arabinose transferase-like glycosyltransferase